MLVKLQRGGLEQESIELAGLGKLDHPSTSNLDPIAV
jgi:hypothetical protein